jgi:hypothetical protein
MKQFNLIVTRKYQCQILTSVRYKDPKSVCVSKFTSIKKNLLKINQLFNYFNFHYYFSFFISFLTQILLFFLIFPMA